MSESKKKPVVAIVVILLIAALGVGAWWYLTHRGASSKENAVFVQNVGDMTGGTAYTNRYNGVVETQKTEKIEFDTNKQLAELKVAEGDTVKEGDPLFTYDTAAIELDIESAELEIEKLNQTIEDDNKQIEQLTKDMNKAKDADKPAFSAQIKDLQADVAQSEYTIKTKNRDIESLKATLENATVTAPISGTITKVGDPSNPGASSASPYGDSTDNSFITILADGDLRVKGTISEMNIYDISVGSKVIVHSRIREQDSWTGTISSIETQTQNDSNNNGIYYGDGERASKYPFYIDLDTPEGLMLGQHVTIEMDYGQSEAKEGLWLSAGWLVQEEAGSYVWAAKEGGKLEKRTVTLGEYDQETDEWQIKDGLTVSDYIAWPDADCKEGAPTTTEYIFNEDEFQNEGDMNFDGDMTFDEGDYTDGEAGTYEEGTYEEGTYEDIQTEGEE